jgi:hypothetical protein
MDKRLRAILVIAIVWTTQSLAQTSTSTGDADLSDTDLSKESENPVTLQITLPLRYQADLSDGVSKQTKDTFEISQAVVPFRLGEEWALITRTKLPAIVQPPKKRDDAWAAGLGNGYTTFFLSPARGNGLYWGFGPLLYYPATSAVVGARRWGSGPSVAFVKKDEGPWVFGAVVNNIWTFGSGPGSGDRTCSFLLNPFVSYHFGDGWSFSSSPNITANWIGTGGRWTVPIGGGLSKVAHVGEQPLKVALDAFYDAIRPRSGKDTAIVQFTLTFFFPK